MAFHILEYFVYTVNSYDLRIFQLFYLLKQYRNNILVCLLVITMCKFNIGILQLFCLLLKNQEIRPEIAKSGQLLSMVVWIVKLAIPMIKCRAEYINGLLL